MLVVWLLAIPGCATVAFEGDEAGECVDGADNDQDGLFDCDDEGCAGSPDCSGDDDTTGDDDAQDDDSGDDDAQDDDAGDDDVQDDDAGDDDSQDDDAGDDDSQDDDVGDDDSGDDDSGDDDDTCSCTADVTLVVGPQFLGVTATARALDQGFPLLSADCGTEYPGSHVCVDREILSTIPAPVPGQEAIVLATVLASSPTGYYLAGGLQGSGTPAVNCANSILFVDDSSTRRVEILTAAGNLRISNCDSGPYVVACCGP